MQRDRTELLLREPNLYKAFIILALPVFGANFMKAFNDLVDTYFIGQLENSVAAQAGVSIAWPLINILISFQVGMSVAGVSIISQLLGMGKKEDARENAGTLLILSMAFGLVLNVLLYLLASPVMRLMGAEGDVLECSVVYCQVRSFELLFAFIFSAFQSIRQAQGDTVTPVVLSVGSVLINIVLTAVLVRGCGLGVFGAGLATAIGQAAAAPICLWLLFSPKQALFLERKHLRVPPGILRRLVVVSIPAALSQALSSLGFLVLSTIILSYGDAVTAAFSIGNKISSMLLMPVLALGSVLAAYVGQNIGAGNGGRARNAYRVSRNVAFGLAVVGSLLLYPLRTYAIQLLTNDPLTQSHAMEYVFWVLATQPLMALFQNYLGVFNGSGHTGYAFLMSTARLWAVRLPLILLFKNFTDVGSAGIWYAMVMSNFLILLLGFVLLRRVDFTPYAGLAGGSQGGE
ncbi:MAG: MATE family efflux transporter [Oscillospiraceae bacterium]|nr:MATE family efflux transporter [Oscillospiraceae bacterium]